MAREQLPAGARKRPGGGYEWRFTVPDVPGRRFSVGAPTIKELKERQAEKAKEIKAGIYKTSKAITVCEYFNEWIDRKRGTVKPITIFTYTKIFNLHIKPAIGSVKVKQLERRQVLALQTGMKKEGRIYLANYCMTLLKSLLKSAVKDSIVIRNVAEAISRLSTKEQKPARETIHRELSKEELKIFFKYSGISSYNAAFHFMLYTGVRAGECAALEWQDIDWKNKLIHIRRTMTRGEDGKIILGKSTKTRTSKRDFPMNTKIYQIIREQYTLYTETHGNMININDPVFPAARGGYANSKIYCGSIKSIVRKIQKCEPDKAIKLFSVHAFRDTFASRAIRAGVIPNTLKEILGHSSLAMTMDLYAHVSSEDKQKAMDVLEAVEI